MMVQGTRNFKLIQLAVCIFFSFLGAIAAEFILSLNYAQYTSVSQCKQEERILHFEECELQDLLVDNGKLYTNGSRPSIIVRDIRGHVDSIQIKMHDLSSSLVVCSVYYGDSDSFSPEKGVHFCFPENEHLMVANIDQDLSVLRIDIGHTSDVKCVIDEVVLNPHKQIYFLRHFQNMSVKRICIYFLIGLFILFVLCDGNLFLDWLFRYRWILGTIMLLGATALKLHGSSIGIVMNNLTGADTSILMGTERAIRSDEYVVFTQMALAQVASGFRWFSAVWGFSPSDMFIIYGQPVGNLITIYRPFSAAYIILGAEYGLAFFWTARTVFLFLVSFEFGRMLTDDHRGISAAYAFLLTLAPVVQWWFSVNGFVEILIFGQGAILLLDIYFKTRKMGVKCLVMAGLVLCAGGYGLTLYPAWMVPFFYVFLACTVAMLWTKRKQIRFNVCDILIWSIGIFVLGMSMLYVIKISGDTIHLVNNTIYPGKREYLGGPWENWIELFRGWTSYLWSFISIENPCEEVGFIDFFPLGIVWTIILLIKEKKRDPWLIIMLVVNCLLISYMLCEYGTWAGEVSLLKYSSLRMVNAIELLNLMMFVRSMVLLKQKRRFFRPIFIFMMFVGVVSICGMTDQLTPALKGVVLLITMGLCYMLFFFQETNREKEMIAVLIGLSVIGGGFVNPLMSGLDTLYHSSDLQNIKAINAEEPGLWMVNDRSAFLSNLPTVVGAHTMTALATYPDIALWEMLKLEDQEEIWNRYAHTSAWIDQKTYVEIANPDYIALHITMEDVKKLGVEYIYSLTPIEKEESVEQIKPHIYRVK